MPKRKIVVLQDDEDWNRYLLEAFNDTPSTPQITRTAKEALPLVRQENPEIVFAKASLFNQPLVAALKAIRVSNDKFRGIRLGPKSEAAANYPFDEAFEEIPSLGEFQKRLVKHLPLPEKLRILVVDDDPQIGEMYRDFFDHRTNPSFMIETARDGVEGLEKIEASPPEVLVLDIKMPRKDGRELYRELKKKGILPPAIVYFDVVSADEVIEIRKMGNPAFVEKGSPSSSMNEMVSLLKKIAYFG